MKLLSPGNESIAFQGDQFFKELVMVFTELMTRFQKEKEGDYLIDLGGRLSATIEHHTSIKTRVDFGVMGPAVEPPDLTKNHALYNQIYRDYFTGKDGLTKIAKDGFLKGSVNLKTAKVSGFFADLESHLYVPTYFLTKEAGFTPEEMAAITLHEVGHLFVYFEYLVLVGTTAVVMKTVSENWNQASVPEREMILTTAAKALSLKSLDAKELAKASDNKIAEVVIVRQSAEAVRDEIGANLYDQSNYEYLADEFASRFGAGRHLVTALDKLYKKHNVIQYRSIFNYTMIEILKLIFTIAGFALIAILLIAVDNQNPHYDRPIDRLRRIRGQMVEELKHRDRLSPEQAQRLLADVKACDEILEGVKDRTQWIEKVINAIPFTDLSKATKQLELQRQLEALALNNLFVKSAELDTLAQ